MDLVASVDGKGKDASEEDLEAGSFTASNMPARASRPLVSVIFVVPAIRPAAGASGECSSSALLSASDSPRATIVPAGRKRTVPSGDSIAHGTWSWPGASTVRNAEEDEIMGTPGMVDQLKSRSAVPRQWHADLAAHPVQCIDRDFEKIRAGFSM